MALIIENKLLFIHVRKTGGSYLRAVLANNNINTENFGTPDQWFYYQHFTINQIHKEFPQKQWLESFAYVREPMQWIRSYWAWAMKSNYLSKKDKIEAARNHWLYDCMSENFIQFLEGYLSNHRGKASEFLLNPLGYEYDMATGELKGKQVVDHVFKYEYLLQELMSLMRKKSIVIDPATLFTTPKRREAAANMYLMNTSIPSTLAKELITTEKHVYSLFYNIKP